jgi:hypothetical protein
MMCGMKRPVVYLIVALLTFLVGFYVSDFGECNRSFGPICCAVSRDIGKAPPD